MEAGVILTAVRYHGTIHDFVMLKPRLQGQLLTRTGLRINKIIFDSQTTGPVFSFSWDFTYSFYQSYFLFHLQGFSEADSVHTYVKPVS